MTNPLLAKPKGAPADDGPMKPGDVRVVDVKDKETKLVTHQVTIVRTDRDYVYDLADAYNASLAERDFAKSLQMAWQVSGTGDLYLGWIGRA